jgi:23S rRNA (uracil1939-C5)-methyltransferase
MTEIPTIREGDNLQLHIEKLVYGGEGLAHHGSQVCFVQEVIPDEEIIATVDTIKRHYLRTSLCEIVAPSAHRTTPLCPIVRDCGGCQWQHIDYDYQLYLKTQILKESLERIAGLQDPIIRTPIASPSPFNYRYRTNLKVEEALPAIGFFKEKTHDLVPVRHCALLAPSLNEALETCWKALEVNPDLFKDSDEIQMLLIHESSQIMLSINNNRIRRENKYLFTQSSQALTPYSGIALEKIYDLRFKRDTESFYQVNYQQNLQMIKLICEYLSDVKRGKILDLYCGCGNFSLFLANEGAEVTGVDLNRFAIKEAKYNADSNGIKRCRFVKADINIMSDKVFEKKFNGVLLNPPRGGCAKKTIMHIVDINPSTIVYVSCDPTTLARDLSILISAGYVVEEIQPVDMFPQTYHIETIVKLTR